jgi:hypothetical protein
VLRSREGSVPAAPGTLIEGHTVAAIYPHAIRLERDASSCWIGMFNERSFAKRALASPPKRNKKPSPSAKHRARESPPFTREELKAGIRKLAAERYRVDRGLVDAAMSRFGSIARRVRVVPVRGSNGVRGLRLAKAPQDGLLASLGLQRNDLLRTVNGYKVGRPDDLMTLYSSLKRVSEVSIALERDGAPAIISYALR